VQNVSGGARVGTLTLGIAPGAPVGSRIKVSGLGMTPAAVWFWSSGAVLSGIDNATARMCQGFGVSATKNCAVATLMTDAADTTIELTHHRTDCCYMVLDTGGASAGRFKFVDKGSGYFTVEITEAFTSQRFVSFMCIPGTEADLVSITEPASTGVQTYATALTGTPGFVAALGVPDTTSAPAIQNNSVVSIGAASGTGASDSFVLVGGGQHNVGTSNTAVYGKSGEILAGLNSGVTAVDWRATVNALNSDGSVALNHVARASSRVAYLLVVRGGSYKVGKTVTSTTLNATTAVSGFGFAPASVMTFLHRLSEATSGTVQNNSYIVSQGAGTSSTNQHMHAWGNSDAQAVADCMRTFNTTDLLRGVVISGSGTDEIVKINSMDADGVTFKQTDGAGAANHWQPYIGMA